MKRELWILFFTSVCFLSSTQLEAGLHNVPIVIPASQVHVAQFHPLSKYRVFRTDPDGTAVLIPFQIDQKDKYGDYILDQGKHPTAKFSNGIFSNQDELCVMGNDVGIRRQPTKWTIPKPNILYEVEFKKGAKEGAIYLGVYFTEPPPLAKENYVAFDLANAQVTTSRYRYLFNNKNYLVVRGVDIEGQKEEQIILSSSVFLKMDLKYFLTFSVGHSDIESELDAFKVGPVRVITRVNFDYKILKLKFDLGMYTEVSFFANAVFLPAVIDNPLDGKKTLNKGSYFYYGLALVENPLTLKPTANMPAIEEKGKSVATDAESRVGHYWAAAKSSNYMLYLEFQPSIQMLKDQNVPYMYVENVGAEELKKRKGGTPLPLGKSPVNVAVSFDLDNFRAGVHDVRFRLFVENIVQDSVLEEFKTIDQWHIMAARLPILADLSAPPSQARKLMSSFRTKKHEEPVDDRKFRTRRTGSSK